MTKRTLRLSSILLMLLTILMVRGISVGAEEPFFRRRLPPEIMEEIKDLRNKLENQNISIEHRASALRKLACIEHEEVIPILKEELGSTDNTELKIEVTMGLGLIGSPKAIPILIDAFNSTTTDKNVQLSCICSLSLICKSISSSEDETLINEISQHDKLLSKTSEEFFGSFIQKQAQFADGILAWAPILKLLKDSENTEKAIFELLSATKVTDSNKDRLTSLFLSAPVKNKRKLSAILKSRYSSVPRNRHKITIINVLASIGEGKALMLKVAEKTEEISLKRAALKGITVFSESLTTTELLSVCRTTDEISIYLLEQITLEWLSEKNMEDFVKKGVGSRCFLLARNTCYLLGRATEEWRKEGRAEPWKAASDYAIPSLLNIMRTEERYYIKFRELAHNTLREIIPTSAVLLGKFDPGASPDSREIQVNDIASRIKKARNKIRDEIDHLCKERKERREVRGVLENIHSKKKPASSKTESTAKTAKATSAKPTLTQPVSPRENN